MKRREFIRLVGAVTVAWPLRARAQAERMRRIGVLGNLPPSHPLVAPVWATFLSGLHERGWVEGRNLLIEARWAAGRVERFAEFAAELVALNVEVILAISSQATQEAKQATSTIPIVFAGVSNPIESGFVASFARPGGSPDFALQWRLVAHFTDQLLRGASAADLPVQQPTTFELVLNLRTANVLGLAIPPSLLASADEVIE